MRRLITLLLCLLTSSGIYAGSASATPAAAQSSAETAARTSRTGAQPIVTDLAPAERNREVPAIDPVWAAQVPVAVAPTERTVAPHVAQRQAGGIAASRWTLGMVHSKPAEPIACVATCWSIIQRGYHATGPPGSGVRMSSNSMARPA